MSVPSGPLQYEKNGEREAKIAVHLQRQLDNIRKTFLYALPLFFKIINLVFFLRANGMSAKPKIHYFFSSGWDPI